jgi:hypothetical protein
LARHSVVPTCERDYVVRGSMVVSLAGGGRRKVSGPLRRPDHQHILGNRVYQ